MYAKIEIGSEIRRRELTVEMGKREACQEYEIHGKTLVKILTHEEPPGYRRTHPRPRKLKPIDPRQGNMADSPTLRKNRFSIGVYRSSELNPVANLWHVLRGRFPSNRTYANVEAVQSAMARRVASDLPGPRAGQYGVRLPLPEDR